MKQLIKRTRIVWLLIVAVSFFGCEDDDDANLPQVEASFVHTINEDTGVVSFQNLSENADSYTWDFGDNTTSTEINPTKVYGTGTYTVVLTAENAAGASGTFEDEIVIDIPLPVNLPVTFDDSGVNYGSITGFDTQFQVVANPELSGANDVASNVGEIVSNGVDFQGIKINLGAPVDFGGIENTIQLKLYATEATDMLVKFSDGLNAARDTEVKVAHGGTGWELLDFNFATNGVRSFIDGDPQNGEAFVPTGQYQTLDLFVGFAGGGVASTFYVDDITFVELVPTNGCNDVEVAAASLPLDFEGCATFPSPDNFGDGITSELTVNPSKTGINTSNFVLKVDKPTGSDFFAGVQNTFGSNFDLTTTDLFKLKVYSTKANVVFRFELLANPNDGSIGNPAPVFVTIPTANEWTEVEFTFTGLPAGPMAYNQLVIKPDNDQSDSAITDGGTYYLDDLTLEEDDPGTTFDDGLLTNGDFENGADSWIGNAVNVVTEGGNSFNLANVTTAVPNEPFQVNLSQVVEITQGSNYILSFDASSDRARTILAGIGLNEAPFTNVNEVVNLTTETQTFTLNLSATDFGLANSRVLFDMAAEVGTVVIDNVSLFLDNSADTQAPVITLTGDATVNLTVGDAFTDPGATASDNVDGDISSSIVVGGDTVDTTTEGTYVITYNVSDAAGNAATQVTRTVNVNAPAPFDDGLLTNGDFENGADSWIGNAVNVVTEGGNSFNLANVTTAVPNEPFQVNLSQVVEIVQGSSYILSFDASSDRARTILAGIGLNEAPFTNVNEVVNLTTDTQRFTLNLTATDFGLANSRVLFDMAAEVGTVVIDNVSLVLDGGGSGTGGCNDTPIAATSLPLDFEGCETFLGAFSSIGDGGVTPSLDANPSKSGINTSDNVLKVVRATGINRWGGVQNSFPAGVIDITTKVFKIKVYSNVADVTYRFELALDPQSDPVTGNPAPQFRQVSGGANEWVELEFTFTNLPATPTTYNQLVIKPDNPDGSDGEVTTEERVFYFDDLRLE